MIRLVKHLIILFLFLVFLSSCGECCDCDADCQATFRKYGNDGHASCALFCAHPKFGGEIGKCVHGVGPFNSKDYKIDCTTSPGYTIPPPEFYCICKSDCLFCNLTDGRFIKTGNNGTVSCKTYCSSTQWGDKSGICILGYNTETDTIVDCSNTPGMLSGSQNLLCYCQ